MASTDILTVLLPTFLPPVFTFPLIPEEHTLPLSLSDHCVLIVLCPPILCSHLLLALYKEGAPVFYSGGGHRGQNRVSDP